MCSVLRKQKQESTSGPNINQEDCIKELDVDSQYIQELDKFSIYLCNEIHEIYAAVFNHCLASSNIN